MIQRIQLQELSPKRPFPLPQPQPQLLLHPHLSSLHPQFVAAKSLIVMHLLSHRLQFDDHIIFIRIYENTVENHPEMRYNSNVNVAY